VVSSPGDLGLDISPVSAAKAEDGDKPRIEKSKFIHTLTHERDRRKRRHDLHYYGGGSWRAGGSQAMAHGRNSNNSGW
jgi:hypothetical protein